MIYSGEINYEKKYKDALERAKKIDIDEAYASQGTIAKTIFPELAESEDERIRKGLIEALKTSKTVGELKFTLPEPTTEECIAYLEKQKEQKHPNGCFTCDEYKKGYEEGRRNGFTAGYNKAMKEVEQKEQHPSSKYLPADWVVYNGPLGHAILQIKDVIDGRYTFVDNDSTLLVEDSDKFLRPLTPKDVEKPAEWSNEDEEIFNNIIEKAKGGHWIEVNEITWLITRFKSLRPQYHGDVTMTEAYKMGLEAGKASSWKPSENIDIYEVAYERYPINNRLVREVTKDINEDTRDGFIDGYKYCDSTRWKPSEEQMSMLLAIINDPNNAGAESCYMALKSIYNQLKKL